MHIIPTHVHKITHALYMECCINILSIKIEQPTYKGNDRLHMTQIFVCTYSMYAYGMGLVD